MNVQIPVDEQLLAEITQAGQSLGLDLTQITRAALQAWLKQREGRRFEQDWMAALPLLELIDINHKLDFRIR